MCQQKALGVYYGGGKREKLQDAVGKCIAKYTASWLKLQKKATGTGATCDAGRFEDNGNGTVTDRLTGLQWEKKTDDGTVHDKDNEYAWSTSGDGNTADADGEVFIGFLRMLNSGGCFAAQCDWRLPTLAELHTILLAPFPCGTSPCVYGIFGPTTYRYHWSATVGGWHLGDAWLVAFADGHVGEFEKDTTHCVRAVRGGL